MDKSGNLFVSNFNCAANPSCLEETSPIHGSIPVDPTFQTVASGFGDQLAVDQDGNLFSLGSTSSPYTLYIDEIVAENGSIPANPLIIPLLSGSSSFNPGDLAVDAIGNLFYANFYNYFSTYYDSVLEIPLVNGSFPAAPTADVVKAVSNDYESVGIALDASSNLFVAESSLVVGQQGNVFELRRSQPSPINFEVSGVGVPSLNSPQSVEIQNSGNATLSLSGVNLSGSAAFTLIPGTGTPADCTGVSSLAPGARCNLTVSFTPGSIGNLTGAITFSDNALNRSSQIHTIPLSGAGEVAPVAGAPAVVEFGSHFGGRTVYQMLQINNVAGGVLNIVPSINGPSFSVSENNCTNVAATGSCSLWVAFNPVTVGPHDDNLTLRTNGSNTPVVRLRGIAKGISTEMEGPLQFGTIAFGTTKVLPLTITNVDTPATVNIGTYISGPSYKILTTAQNTCMAGIAKGQSCILPVEFDPVSTGGHHDTLTLITTPYGESTVRLDGVAD